MRITIFFKRILFVFFSAALLLHFVPGVAAPENWFEKLIHNLQLLTRKQDALKIHLHTDRNIYAAKDTVWYKIYVAEANTLKPLSASDIVNVTLWSEANVLVNRQKLQLKNGLVAGQLVLPDSLAAGRYTLLSYTNWMRNVGREFFFRKTITVLPANEPEVQTTNKNTLADITFFPEGGDLVQGLSSKVGFKAVSGTGLGVPVSGSITDETGKTVATFKSLYAGMGSFRFTPLPGKKYAAKLLSATNQTKNFALPEVKPAGIVISVDNLNDTLATLQLTSTADRFGEEFTVVAQSRNSIRFSGQAVIENVTGKRIQIPKKLMPGGITQLTVFNSQGQPEAERLIFCENRQHLTIQFTPEKATYNRREMIKLQIQTLDFNGKPVPAEISLSAADGAQTAIAFSDISILSNFLLTSDLAGPVENPRYYFSNPTSKTNEALDNLMLTQGWRRFTWQQVAEAEAYKATFMPESKYFLDALVSYNDKPLGNAFVYFLDSQTGQTHISRSDETGNFSIDLTLNTAAQRFSYQVWHNGTLMKKAVVKTIPEINLTPADAMLPAFTDSTVFRKNRVRSRIEKAYSLQHTQPGLIPETGLSWLTVPPDKKYLLENYEPIKDFEEALKEIVPDVRIITATGEPEPRMINKDQRDFFQHQPMFIIDGQPTWNNDFVLRLDADLIREIQLYNSVKSLRQFGFTGNHGVIVIKTKTGNYTAPELMRNNRVITDSFVKAREFYVPKTSAYQPNLPDFRPTLYWNPTIKTDADGKATISFPASDAAAIKIYGEGITNTGLIGTGSAELKLNLAQ